VVERLAGDLWAHFEPEGGPVDDVKVHRAGEATRIEAGRAEEAARSRRGWSEGDAQAKGPSGEVALDGLPKASGVDRRGWPLGLAGDVYVTALEASQGAS
jgi:hypothetical protein